VVVVSVLLVWEEVLVSTAAAVAVVVDADFVRMMTWSFRNYYSYFH